MADTATNPLPYLDPAYRLCYIRDGFAYFSTEDPREVRGDDWNDSPYECNAGEPYSPTRVLAYSAYEYRTPAEVGRYSVDQINRGDVAWLSSWGSDEPIHAGVSMLEFATRIMAAGGEVCVPLSVSEDGDLSLAAD